MLKIDWFGDLHLPSLKYRAADMSKAEQEDMRKTIAQGATDYVQNTLEDLPDFIVNTGDNIHSTPSVEEDAILHDTVCDIFNPLAHIMHTLKGNHDIRHPSLDVSAKFNFLNATKVIEKPEATIVLWNADVKPFFYNITNPLTGQRDRAYKAKKDEIEGLYNILAGTRRHRPVLLFSHIPLSKNAKENPVGIEEEANPGRSYYQNNDKIYKVLRGAERRIFIFSGHRHYNGPKEERLCKGVRLFTIDRAVRWEELGPKRLKGINTARIEVHDDRLIFNRRGAMPWKKDFTFIA